MNSPRFVRQADAELRPVLGDERIVAGAQVVSGPPGYVVNSVSAVVFIASGIALAFALLHPAANAHRGHRAATHLLPVVHVPEAAGSTGQILIAHWPPRTQPLQPVAAIGQCGMQCARACDDKTANLSPPRSRPACGPA
jgi:hypothetical protein